jgi:hypothetical protein
VIYGGQYISPITISLLGFTDYFDIVAAIFSPSHYAVGTLEVYIV